MRIDIEKFRRGVRKAKEAVDEAVLTKTKKLALKVHQTLVLATPVDTGRARNNWLPNAGGPNLNVRLLVSGDGGSILSEGQSVIRNAKKNQAIHFTNNLPYIGALNDGHSAQAPAGFVQKAVLAAEEA